MEKRLSNFYLVIAIIGIITAIPILGSIVDVFRILTFVLLGFSIYILVKQPKGSSKKTGAILMVISCALSLIGGLIMMGTVGSMAGIDTTSDYETGQAVANLVGGSLMVMVFTFPAWVLKIIAIVFSFKASSELKKEA